MIDWLFEIDTLKLSTKDTTYGGDSYSGVVIADSFSGITMRWDISGNGLIAPNDMTFEVANTSGTYSISDFEGEECVVRISEDSAQTRVWKFKINRAIDYYGKIKCWAVGFIQEYLVGDYPNTPSPKEVWSSDDVDENEAYCIPVILGTAYIPVRSVNTGTERFYVLGEYGPTYTVNEVSSPREWPNSSVWDSGSYSFNGYTSGGYQLMQPIIADSDGDGSADAPGLWRSGDTFYDMLCKYSRSDTSSLTNPAEWVEYVLEDFGIASADIDSVSFGAAETLYNSYTLGFDGGGWWEKEPRERVLSNLLAQTDSYLVQTDKIELYQFDATPVETITNVLLKSFKPERLTKVTSDSGRVHWPESTSKASDVLNGKAIVPTHDSGSENKPSSEILKCRFIVGDSINAQKAGILYFQKKYEQSQRISFSTVFTSLTTKATLHPGQVVTVNNTLYGGTNNVIITDMTIKPDMRVDFVGVVLNYLEDWGDLSTASKSVTVDTSDGFTLPTTDYNGNLTASASWDLLLDIPQRFLDTASLGLNVTESYFGWFDGTDFKTYIDSSGNLRCGAPDTAQGFVWNQTTGAMDVSGSFTVQNPSTVRTALNVEDGATNGMTTAEALLLSALQDQTDNKISVYVQEATPSWTDDNADHEGDQWYKPSELKWYEYNGTTWAVNDDSIYDINALAAGKTTYHYASGTSSPSTSLGAVGDFCTYKNTSTGVVKLYKKTGSSTWTEQAGSFADGADNTTTTINGGVITTGSIRDSSSNLVIDFSNAEITVGSTNGLTIESNSKIRLESDASNGWSIVPSDFGSHLMLDFVPDQSINSYLELGRSGEPATEVRVYVDNAFIVSDTAYSKGLIFYQGVFRPSTNGNVDLGSSSYLWNNVYTEAVNFGDDDLATYKEDTYTATLTPGSGSITLDSSANTLAYTRIGNQVTVTGRIDVSSVSSPSGTLSLNLPFSIGSLSEYGEYFSGSVLPANTDTQPTGTAWAIRGGSGSSASLVKLSTTGHATAVASWVQASTTFTFGFTYFAA